MKRSHLRHPLRCALKIFSHRWRSTVTPLGLAALLGVTGSLWLTEALIMPKTACAYVARLDLFLTRERGETYDTFIRRAEMAARAGAQRSFDQDLLITEVAINVIAESEGLSIPVLNLEVDRSQWRNRPETRYWATYYRMARDLFDGALSGDVSNQ
ncbi:MAG: hypothetical protein AAFV72_09890 [Cyanobacteria bacterium J06635_1]